MWNSNISLSHNEKWHSFLYFMLILLVRKLVYLRAGTSVGHEMRMNRGKTVGRQYVCQFIDLDVPLWRMKLVQLYNVVNCLGHELKVKHMHRYTDRMNIHKAGVCAHGFRWSTSESNSIKARAFRCISVMFFSIIKGTKKWWHVNDHRSKSVPWEYKLIESEVLLDLIQLYSGWCTLVNWLEKFPTDLFHAAW